MMLQSMLLQRCASLLLTSILAFTLVAFGGTDRAYNYISIALVATLSLLVFGTKRHELALGTCATRVMYGFLSILALLIMYWLFLPPIGNHPVVGPYRYFADAALFDSVVTLIASAAVFLLAYYLSGFAGSHSANAHKNSKPPLFGLALQLLLIASCIALVAVVSWPSDNGKLFRIFSPDSVFVSGRARWPFVNANHLGHTMAIALPFCAALAIYGWVVFRRSLGLKATSEAIEKRNRAFAKALLLTVGCFIIFTATLASQTRSALVGATLGLIFLVTLIPANLTLFYLSTDNRKSTNYTRSKRRERSQSIQGQKRRGFINDIRSIFYRMKHHLSKMFSAKAYALLLLVTVISLASIFVFRDKGQTVVRERLTAAQVQSGISIRLSLASDTYQIIKANPWFGVGPNGWQAAHAQLPNAQVRGVDPQFAHNEILQLIAELGVVGALMILSILIWIGSAILTPIKTAKLHPPKNSTALLVHLIAYGGLASLVAVVPGLITDFSLRPLGSMLLFAAILGAACAAWDCKLEGNF